MVVKNADIMVTNTEKMVINTEMVVKEGISVAKGTMWNSLYVWRFSRKITSTVGEFNVELP